jgi:hypothetical protein
LGFKLRHGREAQNQIPYSHLGRAVRITEFRTMAGIIMNPKTKAAVIAPPPSKPPAPPDQEGVEKFVDREPAKDGTATVSMKLKTATAKEWMIQTS